MIGVFAQPEAQLCFCWGAEGLQEIGPTVDAVVIVDVLRFTSCVSVACARGAVILPYEWNDDSVTGFAALHNAVVAGHRGDPKSPWSLSPTDLLAVPPGTRLVLPSPNGSALSSRAASLGVEVIAGSLRNATAVGRRLAQHLGAAGRVAVIAAGERWPTGPGPRAAEGALRPAVEDLFGAGAVIQRAIEAAGLDEAAVSPEAQAAAAAFRGVESRLAAMLLRASSGRELVGRFGWTDDIETAAHLDGDNVVPVLRGREYAAGD
jgi:2-phosphosulfolactate phosphatase